MANELSIHYVAGKTTVYFVLRQGGNFALAGGGGLEAYNASHWTNYAISAAEIGATGIYQASMPVGLAAGNYAVEACERLGASPSPGDTWLGAGALAWNGTAEIRPADVSDAAAIRLKTDNLPAQPAATGDVPTVNAIADAVLSRNVSGVEAAAGRTSLTTLVLAATNKANTEDHPGFLTVYRTDGVTEHTRIPISISPTAAPIEGVG
jgi:hypothetical protein